MKKQVLIDYLEKFDDDIEVMVNGIQVFEIVHVPGERVVNIIVSSLDFIL